jgi:agmatinase
MRIYSVIALVTLLGRQHWGVKGWEIPRQDHPPFDEERQILLGGDDDVDIVEGSQFNGLRTYAEFPYLNCFSDTETAGHKYDIAIMGAPHDTVRTNDPSEV